MQSYGNNDENQRFVHCSEASGAPALDTLAQLRTNPQTNKETLLKRARSKFFTAALTVRLADLNSPLKDSYWNTWHCSNILLQDGKKITSKYCNNRWCTVCNRMRTAKLIKGYSDPLELLNDKHFVTLTIPNVPSDELSNSMDKMQSTLKKIQEVFRKRRNKPLIGIRKLECTYNNKRNDYHPHYHLIVSGKEEADQLVIEWLKRFPEAKRISQDVRPANENSTKELFKYFTKLVSKSGSGKMGIYIPALDVMFQAMRGRRVFQPMGVKKIGDISEDLKELESQEYSEIEERQQQWTWTQDYHDWMDYETGEILTGYKPTDNIKELVHTPT